MLKSFVDNLVSVLSMFTWTLNRGLNIGEILGERGREGERGRKREREEQSILGKKC